MDVIVIGGGAAGLMCAIEAGKRGRKVAVLEHADRIGKKILISGGGRCNFTNLHCKPENFISANPHFCKSALARYPASAFIALVEKHGIPYHEKTLGQLFCDRSARDIIGLLRRECDAAGVEIFVNCAIGEVRKTTEFALETGCGPFRAPALVVATGGLSIPKMGATPLGYRIAGQFGLAIQKCRPGLVPLTFNEDDLAKYKSLSGISTEVIASIGKRRFREKMLFTHRGLSGPAILQISSYWNGDGPIAIDLLPDIDLVGEIALRKAFPDKAASKTILFEFLPRRLAELYAPSKHAAALSAREIAGLSERLHGWGVAPAGTEGYAKAEVTAGGIDTNELSSKTFETRKVPGLYFIGEVLDVTGHLGGFNFQWAWASGYSAGRSV